MQCTPGKYGRAKLLITMLAADRFGEKKSVVKIAMGSAAGQETSSTEYLLNRNVLGLGQELHRFLF